MTGDDHPVRDPLLTLTHARVRAGQGDLRGARRVLRGMLATSPEHAQARRLLAELSPQAPGAPDGVRDPRAARIRRLRAWLGRLSR